MMMRLDRLQRRAGWIVIFAALCATPAVAEQNLPATVSQRLVPFVMDSGQVRNDAGRRSAIYETLVSVPDAAWLRLEFTQADLGAPGRGGRPTILRMTSLADQAVQTMTAEHLAQWRYTSAYFNGSQVRVEVIADPGAAPSRIRIDAVTVGLRGASADVGEGGVAGGCIVDDRTPSGDPRVCRTMPALCTAWLADHPAQPVIGAGHCFDLPPIPPDLVEFNVPPTLPDGTLQHPGPEDQYVIDPASAQWAFSTADSSLPFSPSTGPRSAASPTRRPA